MENLRGRKEVILRAGEGDVKYFIEVMIKGWGKSLAAIGSWLFVDSSSRIERLESLFSVEYQIREVVGTVHRGCESNSLKWEKGSSRKSSPGIFTNLEKKKENYEENEK